MGPQGIVVLAMLLLLSGCGREQGRLADGPHEGLKCSQCHDGASGAEFASVGRCVKCHDADALSPEVSLAAVQFPHAVHGEIAPGVATSCSACHVHGSGREDLRVDTAGCFLCHSRLPAPGSTLQDAVFPGAGCLDCHGQPTHTAFRNTGLPIDHAAVLDRGISCIQCHFDVVKGSGAVAEETCRACHPTREADALAEAGEAATVHAQHARDGAAPACVRCHGPVLHRVEQMDTSLLLKCRECHGPEDAAMTPPINAGAHRAQQLLYIGLSEDAAARPDPMFLERVDCAACHTEDAMGHPHGSAEGRAALGRECESCHDDGYARLMNLWVSGVRSRTETVGAYVHDAARRIGARETVAGTDADAAAVDAAAAVRTWEFVRDANGIHNLAATDVLLRRALDDAAGAYRSAGLTAPERPRLGPDPARESCVRCHYGVETLAASATAGGFPHGVHVRDSRFDCVRCHSPGEPDQRDARHGATVLENAGCRCCHTGNRYGGG